MDHQVAQARIADQVKVDILTDTQASDNAAYTRKVSRSFICESELILTNYAKSMKSMQLTQSQVIEFFYPFNHLINAFCSPYEGNVRLCVACFSRGRRLLEPSTNALEAHVAQLTGKEAVYSYHRGHVEPDCPENSSQATSLLRLNGYKVTYQ